MNLAWNETGAEFPAGCLHELFEAQAAVSPDAVAVVCGDAQLSYRELDARANRLAHHLRGLGAGTDDVVGVCVHRSVELLVGLLGVLKAGAAFLPMDGAGPLARAEMVLASAGARVCVVSGALRAAVPGSVRSVVVDGAEPEFLGWPATRLVTGVGADNLVSVYFTSGSTGTPKGVANTHGGWVNRMAWMQRQFGLSAGETVVHKTTLTFGDAGLELFWPLMVGGRVAMIAPDAHRDPAAVAEEVARCRSVYLQVVPSMLTMVVDVVERRGRWLLSTLRDITSSGEALPGSLVAKVAGVSSARLNNTWGATEVSIDSTHHVCTEQDAGQPGAVCVGRPFDNNRVYVLDDGLRAVPVGVVGDLYIGGLGLARCYVGDPARTAGVFVPDPFVAGGRMYATGDCGHFRADGGIVYAGRRDHQVKIRGMRVELGEIEAVLRQHPAVHDTAVIIREDVPNRPGLVAYVIPEVGGAATVGVLVQHCEQTLPDHMVPRLVAFIDEFPLNANGKLDRMALPKPDHRVASRRAGYRSAGNALEKLVLEVFRDVLGSPDLGVDDDFFDTGHSLLAMRAIARLRDAIDPNLPIASLYEQRTAAKLAAVANISAAAGARPATRRPRLVPSGRQRAPLSNAQEQLWLLHQLAPDVPLYNEPVAYVLSGELDVPVLTAAFSEIVRRHEILRTGFRVNGDELEQVIWPAGDFIVPVVDRPEWSADSPALLDELTALARTAFDLAAPGLFDVRLYRLANHEWALYLNWHHMVTDGLSSALLAGELEQGYLGAATAAELPVQYADYAIWQRELLASEAGQRHLEYWRATLEGAPSRLDLPSDRPRPPVPDQRGERFGFQIDRATTGRLRELAGSAEVSLYHVLLAAFTLLMHRLSNQDDVVIGTPITTRGRAEFEELIGYFVNTVPIRSRYAREAGFDAYLDQIRAAVLDATEHRDAPFEQLVRLLGLQGDPGSAPLVQVVLAYQHNFDLSLKLPGMRQTVPLDTGTARFELTFLITESQSGALDGVVEFATDMFDRATIARMVTALDRLLVEILGDPSAAIGDYDIMPGEDQASLLAWNETGAEFPAGCLHELFEAQAAVSPDAVAVVCGDAQLSYRELDARANRLAHHLRGLGAGTDDVVGVCVHRSVELLVGLLGVLKAGAAFLPMDGAGPLARAEMVLASAGARVCVVSGALRAAVPGSVRSVVVDGAEPEFLGWPATRLVTGVGADNLVSVYFTSGSTGTPKGVANTHGGWVNRMAWMQRQFGLSAGETVVHKTTLTFDDAGLELFWPLMVGGRVAMIAPDAHRDPAAVAEEVARCRSVYLQVVPSMLTMVVDVVERRGRWLLSTLRDITSSGEALPGSLVAKVAGVSSARLNNTWGATEVSIDSTHHVCTEQDAGQPGAVCVGRPFDNNRVYVLDDGLRAVPVGVVGDLYIGGLGLARCYVGDPARTAGVFVPDPFVAGGRMYATGDCGHFRADGGIVYAGRRDHQVKIRGMRVELGEIEAVLRQHPAVHDTAVIIHDTDLRRLVAFVSPSEVDRDALQAHLAGYLPGYMVPSVILTQDLLPLNANGKIDRRALVVPDEIREHGSSRFVPCDGLAETALAEIWCELLGLDSVGGLDDFFELGGHSLLAARLMARVGQRFDIEMPLSSVFANPTIQTLAHELELLLGERIEQLSDEELATLLNAAETEPTGKESQ